MYHGCTAVLIPSDRPHSIDLDLQLDLEETEDGATKSRPDPPANQKYNESLDKSVLTAEICVQWRGLQEKTGHVRQLEQILARWF